MRLTNQSAGGNLSKDSGIAVAWGEAVKTHRKKANMTQVELAKAVSLSAHSIHKIESGRHQILLQHAVYIAEVLSISLDKELL
jgi:DNA-binding XRE family transcriptional regulator